MPKNLIFISTALLASSAVFAQSHQDPRTNPAQSMDESRMIARSDADIMRKIAIVNLSEIEIGRLAMQNGSSGFGRDYGSMMVDHHTQAQNELAALASQSTTWLPVGMDVEHRGLHTRLFRMIGPAFDRSYSKEMANGHEKVYWQMSKWREESTNPALSAYIDKYMPTVMSHQIAAREAYNMKFWMWDREYNM